MKNGLKNTFIFKIALTLLAWVAPLLFFPVEFLVWLGFPEPQPIVFIRLLGVAYLALVSGYHSGLKLLQHGVHPGATVWMGIYSNAGAGIILAWYAVTGLWQDWGLLAQIFMWFSLAGVSCITMSLYWYGVRALHRD